MMNSAFLERPRAGISNEQLHSPDNRPSERPVPQHASQAENTNSTLTEIRAKIADFKAKWEERNKLHARYSEITEQSLPEEQATTWSEKLNTVGQVITRLPAALYAQAERTLKTEESRKQFAAKVLEESYAIAAGISARAAVIATGSLAIVTLGGASISALPIAAAGIMAAGAAREVVKNRHMFWGKDTNKFGQTIHHGRQYFMRELGIKSFQSTPDSKTGRKIASVLTTLSTGLKTNAIVETFEAEKYQVARHDIHRILEETPEMTLIKLNMALQDRSGAAAIPVIAEYMKTTKIALDTARTKEERLQARDTIKHLYKMLINAAEKQGQTTQVITKKGEHSVTVLADEVRAKLLLQEKVVEINAELDNKGRIAAKQAIKATAVQNLFKFAAGIGIYDAADRIGIVGTIKNIWADAMTTPSVAAAERRMDQTVIPQIIEDAHKTIAQEKKPKIQLGVNLPTQIAEPIAPNPISLEPLKPTVELMPVEIKAGSDLFHGLKYAGFDISADGSAQKFVNQVAPLFIERGQMTQDQLDQMKALLKGDNADNKAEWLRIAYEEKYGKHSFDNLFIVQEETIYIPKEDISARYTINPTILQSEIGPTIAQPRQELPAIGQAINQPVAQPAKIIIGETIPQPPVVNAEVAPVQAIAAPQTEAHQPAILGPAIAPRRVETIAVMPTAISQDAKPVKEVVAINPNIMTLNKLRLSENATSTVTITSNREDIFKLQGDSYAPTAKVIDWVKSSDPSVSPIDAITYKVNDAVNVITMNWHSLFSKYGRQLAEGVRTYMEGGYNNAPRLTEIQINQRMQELANGPDTYLNFNQSGQQVSYELTDTHYQSRFDTLTQGLWVDQYASAPNQLVITYCGWAHADSFKILSTTQDIPENIQDALDIIKANNPETDIKGAVKTATEWYAQNYSNKDTATVLKDLRAMVPAELKPQVDILNNPHASPEKVHEATMAVSNWFKKYNPEAYDMFKLMFDGMGHVDAKDGWMKKNFFEYYSWRRHILILTPEQQIEASGK